MKRAANKNTCAFKRVTLGLLFLGTIMSTVLTNAEPILKESTSSLYALEVEPLHHSQRSIQKSNTPLYRQISPFYLSQLTDSSCSLASATIIINALRSQQKMSANYPVITQDELLNRVKDEEWRFSVRQGGDGVTLEQLKRFMAKTLQAFGIDDARVEAIHLTEHSAQNARLLNKTLTESNNTANVFVIANFNQKFFTGGMSVGHFSPVGAYDVSSKRVLIMDTDAELEPYWATEERFFDSMVTQDEDAGHYRGYLVIRLKS